MKRAVTITVFIGLVLLFTGCSLLNEETINQNINDDTATNQTRDQEVKNNNFISSSNNFTFSYKNDWTCKEVVNNKRVDCYPSSRQNEEYEAGLDQPTVYYPNISIWINNCSATSQDLFEENPDMPILQFIKSYSNCTVLVTSTDETIKDEDDINKIIF